MLFFIQREKLYQPKNEAKNNIFSNYYWSNDVEKMLKKAEN